MLRLPETSTAHQAIQESLRPVKRSTGKPKTTWISMLNNELKELNLQSGSPELQHAAADRQQWRAMIKGVCRPTANKRHR